MRVRLDYTGFRQPNQCLSIKVFNRGEQKLNNYLGRQANQPLLFDVPFCDAEAIFGTSQKEPISVEFVTEDPKAAPIKIVAIEFLGVTKKDFQFKEKMRKLEKLNADRLKKSLSTMLGVSPSQEVLMNQQIRDELLNTKGVPVVSWREKQRYLSGQVSEKSAVEMVIAMDVLTQYLTVTPVEEIGIDLEQLLSQLKPHLSSSLTSSPTSSLTPPFELAAVKRCIKRVLALLTSKSAVSLGHPYHYETLKDQMLIAYVRQRLEKADFASLDQWRTATRRIIKINVKRFYQIFKVIQDNPHLVQQMIEAYIDL